MTIWSCRPLISAAVGKSFCTRALAIAEAATEPQTGLPGLRDVRSLVACPPLPGWSADLLDGVSEPDAPAFALSLEGSLDHFDIDDVGVCVSFVVNRRGAFDVDESLLAI